MKPFFCILCIVVLQRQHHGLAGHLPFCLPAQTMDRKAMFRFGI